ncbi:MAG: cardiolipin synthase [Pseudomonadota bacterium]
MVLTVQVCAVIAAIAAIRTARTPQGAVGWVVFLLAAPYVALPLFLVLGHSRYPGYAAARRSSARIVRAIDRFGKDHQTTLADGDEATAHTAKAFEALAALPVVSGNGARVLVDGKATFDAIFQAIDQAQSYVLVQFYIVRDDEVGRALKERLIAKARAGCTVRLLYDALGSHGLDRGYLDALGEAGVIVRDFHSLRRPRSRFQINFRNHRKIVVVDGQVGFVGGHNVGDEYLGGDKRLTPWRDTHVRLEGPVVAQLQLVFLEDWYWCTEEQLSLQWLPDRAAADVNALVLASGPADDVETGTLYFLNAIDAAKHRIFIASPYFVPDGAIIAALQLAALRGVDVRIVVPDARDHLLVWLAAFAYFDEVRAAGVTILRYSEGFMHQKVVLVDDTFASIGSINLDNRSCRLNFEVTAIMFDRAVVNDVAEMLEADMAKSRRHDTPLNKLPNRLVRLGAPFARLFAPIL